MIWIFLIQPILAIQGGITSSSSNDTRSLLCTPFGVCEPCPVDSVRLVCYTITNQLTKKKNHQLDEPTLLPAFRKSTSYALYKL